MAADKECVVVTTTAKSLIGQLAPGRSKQGLREYSHWSTGIQAHAGETGPQSDKQVLLNILKENGDSVEQERIFSWRNSLITAWSSLPRPV